jgi:hypothetical protein
VFERFLELWQHDEQLLQAQLRLQFQLDYRIFSGLKKLASAYELSAWQRAFAALSENELEQGLDAESLAKFQSERLEVKLCAQLLRIVQQEDNGLSDSSAVEEQSLRSELINDPNSLAHLQVLRTDLARHIELRSSVELEAIKRRLLRLLIRLQVLADVLGVRAQLQSSLPLLAVNLDALQAPVALALENLLFGERTVERPFSNLYHTAVGAWQQLCADWKQLITDWLVTQLWQTEQHPSLVAYMKSIALLAKPNPPDIPEPILDL